MKLYPHPSREPAIGSVSFDYRGYTISLSNVFAVSSLRVFKGKQDVTETFFHTDPGAYPTAFRMVMNQVDTMLDS